MTNQQPAQSQTRTLSFRLSLDAWAVLAAFAIAAFVRFGILKHIPW